MLSKKDLQKMSRNVLLKRYVNDPKNNIEAYYNQILEDMYEVAKNGGIDYRLFKEDYDDITWFSLLRLFLLDEYDVTYYNAEENLIKGFGRDGEVQEANFENATMVSIGWGK